VHSSRGFKVAICDFEASAVNSDGRPVLTGINARRFAPTRCTGFLVDPGSAPGDQALIDGLRRPFCEWQPLANADRAAVKPETHF
jgi:hypothetical protein